VFNSEKVDTKQRVRK